MDDLMDQLDEVRDAIEALNANRSNWSEVSGLHQSFADLEATLLQRVKIAIRWC